MCFPKALSKSVTLASLLTTAARLWLPYKNCSAKTLVPKRQLLNSNLIPLRLFRRNSFALPAGYRWTSSALWLLMLLRVRSPALHEIIFFPAFDLPSGNEIFSLPGFTILCCQIAPLFLPSSLSVFLAFRFPQAYNPIQQSGLHGLNLVQFPNLP
jgi:hypothetical protein